LSVSVVFAKGKQVKDFYTRFYAVVEHSPAHHNFCERAFGKDLCQHGFTDLARLDLLMQVTQLGPAHRALDLGCGNGMMSEYLSDVTGSHITGLDYIASAIARAQERTAAKSERLAFSVTDINHLELPPQSFDIVLSIDSIYFSENYTTTIGALKAALRPRGQMAIFYSYGREPSIPKAEFPVDKLPALNTPLADALTANNLAFRSWDLTRQDYDFARRRREILEDLKPQFEAEGIMFIYENRLGECKGICRAVEDGLHARYLYHVQLGRSDSGLT